MVFFPAVISCHESRQTRQLTALRMTGLFLGMALSAAPATAQVAPTTGPAVAGVRAPTTNAAPPQAGSSYGPQRPAQNSEKTCAQHS